MRTLLDAVHAELDRLGIAHALIGAAALATHGVGRSTMDLDLLVSDRRCLDRSTWKGLETRGAGIEIRRGDADDPLAGVARLTLGRKRPVDVIVGKGKWQQEIVDRAPVLVVRRIRMPVAAPADLVLLKLYAGGPQDRWDILQLLGGRRRDVIAATVDANVGNLPARCRKLWKELRGG